MSRPRAAPRCIVCDRAIVVARRTMCQGCGEAFDRWRRRTDGGSNMDLIEWAAGRARRTERRAERARADIQARKRWMLSRYPGQKIIEVEHEGKTIVGPAELVRQVCDVLAPTAPLDFAKILPGHRR